MSNIAGPSPRPDGAAPLVVGFGEALLRLTAHGRAPLEHARSLDVDVGGAELNMLAAAAQLGCRTRWVSRLPDTPLGRRVASHARRHGVLDEIEWEDSGGRLGLYFVEEGVPPRPTRVLYDRLGSAASRLQPGMFDWPRLLEGAAALHCSGITCALGPDAEKAVLEALEVASAEGVRTSFDLNYRSQLWSPEVAAVSFKRILPLVNVLFASPFDLTLLTARDGSNADLADGVRAELGLDLVVVRSQHEVGPGTIRVEVSASREGESATRSAVATVIDAFGAGDVAAAAFLSRLLVDAPLDEAAEAAAAASAYMYTLPGDAWVRPPGGFAKHEHVPGRIIR